jgi:carbamoyltransferase
MAYFLGLFGYGPNPSAALLRDGEIVAFAEEERFNRIKTAPNSPPITSAFYCLKEAGIDLDDVQAVRFGWDCERYVRVMPEFYRRQAEAFPVDSQYADAEHERYLLDLYNPKRIFNDLRLAFAARGHKLDRARFDFVPHHLAHCASTYFASGYEEASILSIDGSGEDLTLMMAHGKGLDIHEIERVELPHSLGGYYATFTEFLGFRPYHDEGKVMGLAPYGIYSEAIQKQLDQILSFDADSGEFKVNPYMRFRGARNHGRRFTDRLVEVFGPPRLSHQPLDQRHRDIAYNVQWRLERIAQALAHRLIRKTGSPNLCLAGGVAMNCKMNGVLSAMPELRNIYVQPASADNGIALGAAYLAAREAGVHPKPMPHAYWGPSFDDKEIEGAIRESKLPYRRSSDMIGETARYLQQGRIVGWFQGRMEIGARALGGRSILANPLIADMRDKLNLEVKHRENWRPFCPSLPADDYSRYFDSRFDSDYMILAFGMRPDIRDYVPAVVHVDGTARPQTVRRDTNQPFYDLLKAFGRLTGHPVLVNTSFNIQGEPVVCTPRDALRCFGGTGLDVLVMGDFMVEKPQRS